MSNIAIGTCVRHVPPRPHQQFIGSGVIFDLNWRGMACSIVLLDGRVITNLPLTALIDGSWVISQRTMTLQQIDHLLAHANEWEDWWQNRMAAGADVSGRCGDAQGGRSQDLSRGVHAQALSPEGRRHGFSRDGPARSLDVVTVDLEGE